MKKHGKVFNSFEVTGADQAIPPWENLNSWKFNPL